MMDFLIGVGGFIAAFGLAVFIHELGHFLAAKMFKVPVERFVIGFDKDAMPFLPRCIIEKKFGETVYGLSLVPIGGYVKMSGTVHPAIERYLEGTDNNYDPPMPAHDQQPSGDQPKAGSLQGQAMQDMAALYKKPFWQKTIIYSAGVFMNMVLAMFVIVFMAVKGSESDAPLAAKVSWIPPGNAYAQAGLVVGEKVLAVNSTEVTTQEDVARQIILIYGKTEKPEQIEVRTESATVMLATPADDQQWADLSRALMASPPWIEFVLPNRPADKAGFKRGDLIVGVNGEPIEDWSHFQHIVSSSVNKPLSVEVARGDERLTLEVTPWENADDPERGEVGLMPGNPEKIFERMSVGEAVAFAPGRTIELAQLYVRNLKELAKKAFRGNVRAVHRELGGPVGIAQLAYNQARLGLDHWLKFLILLNIALAVMNILPIPVLDGGHICFATYEALFRRPVPPQVLVPVLNGAVLMLLVFFIVVTFSDIFKIFA